MSDLSYLERNTFEKLFDMASGTVMDFSNRTFREFIGDSVDIDIYDEKYNYESGSKANRLRSFIAQESNNIVAQLLESLLKYWNAKSLSREFSSDWTTDDLHRQGLQIVEKLRSGNIVDNIEAIQPNSNDKDFATLAKSIRASIDKNEPETALDRLHTFVMKYVRRLCENHNVEYSKDESLHSIFGKYVKFLQSNSHIDTVMSERILKTSISLLDSFNDIRNNNSFAHDNPILSYEESVLIFNSISNSIRFIDKIESKIESGQSENKAEWRDMTY